TPPAAAGIGVTPPGAAGGAAIAGRIGVSSFKKLFPKFPFALAWRFTCAKCSLRREQSTKKRGPGIREGPASMARKDRQGEQGPSVSPEEALEFHAMGRPGKLEIVPTKPMATQRDLSLAYSPGVAAPVQAIADDPSRAYDYTSRGNMVAVISNGTAILGMGNL